MTPPTVEDEGLDLGAIRARCAATLKPGRWLAGFEGPLAYDALALLTEVERLTAELAALRAARKSAETVEGWAWYGDDGDAYWRQSEPRGLHRLHTHPATLLIRRTDTPTER